MCTRKDIDAVFKQLQLSQDHEEKRRILEQLTSCETCKEKINTLVKGDMRCSCEIDRYTEFLNTIEHVIQHCISEK
jgi:uncharacterized protein YuzB (UPF0349 family)